MGGTSWYYHARGIILKAVNGSLSRLQDVDGTNHWGAIINDTRQPDTGLAKITIGDKITVIVKEGKLTFEVNGAAQGPPIDLPAGAEVAMAVSLCYSGGK